MFCWHTLWPMCYAHSVIFWTSQAKMRSQSNILGKESMESRSESYPTLYLRVNLFVCPSWCSHAFCPFETRTQTLPLPPSGQNPKRNYELLAKGERPLSPLRFLLRLGSALKNLMMSRKTMGRTAMLLRRPRPIFPRVKTPSAIIGETVYFRLLLVSVNWSVDSWRERRK